MEAQTDVQTYLDQGKQALAGGQGREAAIAYAHGAQIEPDNPMVRLGLAEANLALGDYDVVRLACNDVLRLQQEDGTESKLARALLDLLNQDYEQALELVNDVIQVEPGIAYAHALRAHLLRSLGQDYDANLARARAARLSYGGRFENSFPPVVKREPRAAYMSPYAQPSAAQQQQQMAREDLAGNAQSEREPVPAWSRPNGFQRQMVRTRFFLSRYPGMITNILIALNVIIFILSNLFPEIQIDGAQANPLVFHGEYWRVFTGMFLHVDIFHIGLNMLSLYFVGRTVEVLYGPMRYLAIYFLSGIAGGLLFLFTDPTGVAVGASGAIFGIFGALGVFYIVNRRALGVYGRGAISQWLFWIALNIIIGAVPGSNIALTAHIGGLIAGMLIAFLFIPRLGKRWRI
ncbi:MAG: rhomboid family intramembrane serine protease [Ktedonobacteraceae bacterium]|nr:rhomboid family intramembrane serine protease [Ktedonobacteraceae bacterium]